MPAAEHDAAVVFTDGDAGVVNWAAIENGVLDADVQLPFPAVTV